MNKEEIKVGKQYQYESNIRIVDDIKMTYLGMTVVSRTKLKNGKWGTKRYTLLTNFAKKAKCEVMEGEGTE